MTWYQINTRDAPFMSSAAVFSPELRSGATFSAVRQGQTGVTHENVYMDNVEIQETQYGGYVGYLIGGNNEAGDSIALDIIPVFRPATNSWIRVPTNGKSPSPRSRHSAVVVTTRIYIYGGVAADQAVHVLDTITSTWSSVGSTKLGLGESIFGHTAHMINDEQMFVIGGKKSQQSQDDAIVSVFSFRTFEWETLKKIDGHGPPSLSRHASSSKGRKIYVFGGECGGQMYILDTERKRWQSPSFSSSDAIPTLNRHFAVTVGDFIYTWGGMLVNKTERKELNESMYRFDTVSTSWEKLPKSAQNPHGRVGHSLVILGQSIFLFGGQDQHKMAASIYRFETRRFSFQKPPIESTYKPVAISSHCAFMYGQDENKEMYVLGGVTGGASTVNFSKFDIIKCSWSVVKSEGSDSPIDLVGHTATVVGDKVYLFGGGNGRTTRDNDMYEYSFASGLWTKVKTSGSPPAPRVGHSAVSHKEDIIFFGGYVPGRGYTNELHVYVTASQSWRHPAVGGTVPSPRLGSFLAIVGKKLYLHGGSAGKAVFADVHICDLVKMMWSNLEKKSSPALFHHSGAYLPSQQKIFVFGGKNETQTYLNTTYSFDLITEEWERTPLTKQLPEPRAQHSIVPYENKLILFAGTDESQAFDDIWILDTDIMEEERVTEIQVVRKRRGSKASSIGSTNTKTSKSTRSSKSGSTSKTSQPSQPLKTGRYRTPSKTSSKTSQSHSHSESSNNEENDYSDSSRSRHDESGSERNLSKQKQRQQQQIDEDDKHEDNDDDDNDNNNENRNNQQKDDEQDEEEQENIYKTLEEQQQQEEEEQKKKEEEQNNLEQKKQDSVWGIFGKVGGNLAGGITNVVSTTINKTSDVGGNYLWKSEEKVKTKEKSQKKKSSSNETKKSSESILFGPTYIPFTKKLTDDEIRIFDEELLKKAEKINEKEEEYKVLKIYLKKCSYIVKERRKKQLQEKSLQTKLQSKMGISSIQQNINNKTNNLMTTMTATMSTMSTTGITNNNNNNLTTNNNFGDLQDNLKNTKLILPQQEIPDYKFSDDTSSMDPTRREYIIAANKLLENGDIKQWLTTIGVSYMWSTFERNEIDLQSLLLCSRDDWESMGMNKAGALQKIILATDALKDLEASLQAEGRLKNINDNNFNNLFGNGKQLATIHSRYRILLRENMFGFGNVLLCQDIKIVTKALQELQNARLKKYQEESLTLFTTKDDWHQNEGAVVLKPMTSEEYQQKDIYIRDTLWETYKSTGIVNHLHHFKDSMGVYYIVLEPTTYSLKQVIESTSISIHEKIHCLSEIAKLIYNLHNCGFVTPNLSIDNIALGLNVKQLYESVENDGSISEKQKKKVLQSWKLCNVDSVQKQNTEVLLNEYVEFTRSTTFTPPEALLQQLEQFRQNELRKKQFHEETSRILQRRNRRVFSKGALDRSEPVFTELMLTITLSPEQDVFCFGVLIFLALFGPLPKEVTSVINREDPEAERKRMEEELKKMQNQQKIVVSHLDSIQKEITSISDQLRGLASDESTKRVRLESLLNACEFKKVHLKKELKSLDLAIELKEFKIQEKFQQNLSNTPANINKQEIILSNSLKNFIPISKTTSVGKLLYALLDEDPSKRPTMKEVKNHDLFRGEIGVSDLDKTFFPLIGLTQSMEESATTTINEIKQLQEQRELSHKLTSELAALERERKREEEAKKRKKAARK